MKLDQIEESVVSSGSSRKLYQGLAKLTPVAVNPTKEQLGKILGTEIERDITYENGDNYRLDFWCREDSTNKFFKFSIFVSNEDVISKQSGNPQFINSYGKTGYYPNVDAIKAKNESASAEWQKMKLDGLRIAKKGEATLYEFLIALFNAAPSKPFPQFESFQKITMGSIKELKDVLEAAIEKERVFHMLLGVKDGKYQDAWTGMFLPAIFTSKAEQYLVKKATNPDYPYKGDWGNNLAFREYIQEAAPVGIEEEATASAAVSDDLPW